MGHGQWKKRESTWEPLDRVLKLLLRGLDLVLCVYILFVLVALPLYNHWDYGRIGSNKVSFLWAGCRVFAVLLGVLGGLWVLLQTASWIKKNGCDWKGARIWLKGAFSVTDVCVAGYGLAMIISYCCTDYKEYAFMGLSSWGMGAMVQLVFVAAYFGLSRVWRRRAWFLLSMLPTTAVLFALGVLNRFDIYPIAMGNAENKQFISLVGNINWFCGYMVLPIFACACFFWCREISDWRLRALFDGYLGISFAALVTNGSSSGVLTLCGVFFLMFVLSVKDAERLEAFCRLFVLFSLTCLVILGVRLLFPEAINYRESVTDLLTNSALPVLLFPASVVLELLVRYWRKGGCYPVRFLLAVRRVLVLLLALGIVLFAALITLNTAFPGSIGPLSDYGVFTFSPEWGSRRGATWQAGARLWLEISPLRKLVGVGPDCMWPYLLNDASGELLSFVRSVWPSSNLTNSHCELLTMLVQEGVLGFLSLAGILGSAVWRYLRQLDVTDWKSCVTASCGMAIAAYTLHNMVSFQQVLNVPTMFVLLGIGEAFYRERERKESLLERGKGKKTGRRRYGPTNK